MSLNILKFDEYLSKKFSNNINLKYLKEIY